MGGRRIPDRLLQSLVFVRRIVTADELAARYAASIDPIYDEEDNLACLDYYYRRLKRLLETRLPRKGRLLDLGCASGRFLDLMQGWECYGAEIVPAYVEIAQKRHGDRILAGAFEDYPIQSSFFDAITLQDVFDHMPQPLGVLRQCHAMLRPGGLLVIKVHNISCLYARITGRKFYALVPPSHLFYYNRRTLKLALEATGFHVREARFIGHLLRLQTVFFRLSRGNPRAPSYRIYRRIAGSWLGNLRLRKNLHDIITVVAQRD